MLYGYSGIGAGALLDKTGGTIDKETAADTVARVKSERQAFSSNNMMICHSKGIRTETHTYTDVMHLLF